MILPRDFFLSRIRVLGKFMKRGPNISVNISCSIQILLLEIKQFPYCSQSIESALMFPQ